MKFMDKVLVILLNRNNDYVRPFNVIGNVDDVAYRLSYESKCNQFVYCLYVLNDVSSSYIPMYYLYNGRIYEAKDHFVRVVHG